ncbi:hypothetical protein EXIGLDRAFT_518231 [Exidia glandulosa HHB12029]|uniref:Uncharacterized protein n=1 Tax=Exidia glandulosa HHB12029 TaxID=1314781 RepID=A0A165J644_EXIGL|nr:hypothetical protein EXIGLDRAFT_518231 [Exidia glandulosa HHB12029]
MHACWFGRDDIDDGRRRLTRVGWDEENKYGFIDPEYVLRACHIAPAFARGTAPFRAALRRAEEEIIITSMFSEGPTATCSCASAATESDTKSSYRNRIGDRQHLRRRPATGSEPEPTEEDTRDRATERGSEAGHEINVDLEARREAGDSDDKLDGDAQGGDEDDEEEDEMGMEDDGADADYFGLSLGNEKEQVDHDSPTTRRGYGE